MAKLDTSDLIKLYPSDFCVIAEAVTSNLSREILKTRI
jgi:hypothetical protein